MAGGKGKSPDDVISKDIQKGIVKVMILSYIRNNKTYPYALLKFMNSAKKMHGFGPLHNLNKNDIYNLTSSLEKEGYIKSKAKLSGNKVQKVFAITRKGNNVVNDKERIFKDTFMALKKLAEEEFIG